jgi:hypothetical protein
MHIMAKVELISIMFSTLFYPFAFFEEHQRIMNLIHFFFSAPYHKIRFFFNKERGIN